MATTSAYTLEQWIVYYRNTQNTVSANMLLTAISNGESATMFMEETLLSKYTTELSAFLETTTLTSREQQYYAYNPRLLSQDLYGAPEFWYIILYANEMHSALEFNVSKMKFYRKGVLDLLNSIRLIETGRKDANAQEMTDVVVNNESMNADVLNSDVI